MNKRKNILVFASGDKEGGGSEFQEMVERSRTNPRILDANIVGVVSNHPNGGVYKKARDLDIPFHYFSGPFTAEEYLRLKKLLPTNIITAPINATRQLFIANNNPLPLPTCTTKLKVN